MLDSLNTKGAPIHLFQPLFSTTKMPDIQEGLYGVS